MVPGVTDEEEFGMMILKQTGVTHPRLTASEALLLTDFKRIIIYRAGCGLLDRLLPDTGLGFFVSNAPGGG